MPPHILGKEWEEKKEESWRGKCENRVKQSSITYWHITPFSLWSRR